MADTPVVLVNGSSETGTSALMQSAELGGNKAANVFSFDDPGARILLARTRCEQHVPNWPFRLLDQGGESLRPANAGMMPPRRITMPKGSFWSGRSFNGKGTGSRAMRGF